MNINISNLLSTGDKLMPELNLKQPGFTYSTCGPFDKYRGRINKIEKLVTWNIYIEMNYAKFVLLIAQHILIEKI